MTTSVESPLRIDVLTLVGGGSIGMTLCPGKKQHGALSSTWNRDLNLDLAAIARLRPDALVTLMESHELMAVQVPPEVLAQKLAQLGIDWYHLPIADMHAPDADFDAAWSYAGTRLHRILARGGTVVLHCLGGLGRTGTVAARLLVERGESPDAAMQRVRAVRRHAIERDVQEQHIHACTAQTPLTDALTRWERALGSLLGGAVGDAFGYSVEFDHLSSIRARFGPDGIRAPVLVNGRLVVSDDTQMTLFTLEGLLNAVERDAQASPPALLAAIREAYLDWYDTQRGRTGRTLAGTLAAAPELRHARAPGTTCMSALADGGQGRTDAPVNNSKGCGGVMRVAPIGLWPSLIDAPTAFRLGAESAALTHGHPSGYLSAGAMAVILRLLMHGLPLTEAARVACAVLPAWPEHEETLTAIEAALTAATPTPTADYSTVVRGLGLGWVGEEALAIGLYAALMGDSFADTLAIAANHDGDSDSTASIAGQLWGAWRGLETIPHGWVSRLDVLAPTLHLAHRWREAT